MFNHNFWYMDDHKSLASVGLAQARPNKAYRPFDKVLCQLECSVKSPLNSPNNQGSTNIRAQ